MSVESQDYNKVPDNIWDEQGNGFRPLTKLEKYQLAVARAMLSKGIPANPQDKLADKIREKWLGASVR